MIRRNMQVRVEFITVVPLYPLIQYQRFQLSMVYRGPKKYKVKEING
jgi:hypothetical protein